MQLSQAIDAFILSMTGVWSKSTTTWYTNRLPSLVEFLGDVEIKSITLTQLRSWRAWLQARQTKWGKGSSHPKQAGGLSPFTMHQYIRGAKRFFVWCTDEEIVIQNPARRLEKPHVPKNRPKGISTLDRDKLLAEAGDDPRARLIILFLSDTGCRVAGLAGLLLDDIDLEAGWATIREKGRGGWGKERLAFYGRETAEAIRTYLAVRPETPGINTLMVGHPSNGPRPWVSYSSTGIRLTLKRLAERAGVKANYNPHSFRHAAIRAWLDNGMPISEVAMLAGHASVTVTADVYGVVSDAKLKAEHQKYSWLKG